MADIVEVIARIGDSIVAVAHGASITVGETGEIYAPAPNVTFAADAISDHTRTAGLLSLEIRRVPAASDRVPRKRFEGRPAAYLAFSLLVHLAVWNTSMHAGRGDFGIGEHPRYARALPVHAPVGVVLDGIDDSDHGAPVPMALDEHAHGIGWSSTLVGDMSGETVGHVAVDVDHAHRRDRAIADARGAGILGSEALRGDRPLGDIPGTGSPASGFDGSDIDGAARGTEHAASFAAARSKGGCTQEPCGTIGTGHYGTLCGDPNGKCRYGTQGYGALDHMRRDARVPQIYLCGHPDRPNHTPCMKVAGDMDKAIIRRYIRRKLPAITGCYEKQLLVDANLSGTVDTSFLIDPTGHARDITTTGMDPAVASCIATVLSTIQFPLSDGGGSTQVHYPFRFFVAGS